MDPWLIVLIIIAASLLFLFGMYILLIAPRVSKKEEMRAFCRVRYAHRGLHSDGKPENSIAAFEAAVQAGYGIELDVRLSKDGELVVFHDDTLDRMTGEVGRVDARTLAELKEIKLAGTEFVIPTFREVLDLVDGRVPLLVELKEDAGKLGVTRAAVEMLKKYKGEYIIESFNPLAIAEVKKLSCAILRGVLSQNFLEIPEYKKPLYAILSALLLNVVARPDFIAFDHKGYKNASLKLIKGLFKTPCLSWTTRSEEEDRAALAHGFDSVIFEKYTPCKEIKE